MLEAMPARSSCSTGKKMCVYSTHDHPIMAATSGTDTTEIVISMGGLARTCCASLFCALLLATFGMSVYTTWKVGQLS